MRANPDDAPRPTPSAPAGGWSPAALVSFAVILCGLLAVGLTARGHRPARVAGLPEDAEARAALDLLVNLRPFSGDLRLPAERPLVTDTTRGARWNEAAAALAAARRRTPRDPRLPGQLGHLEMSRLRFAAAERHYRRALALAPGYAEARIGLGCALALRGRSEENPRGRRALALQAIAQFAAVDEADPLYAPALYNRVLLLAEVGRVAAARAGAAAYRSREPDGPWSAALDRTVAGLETR